MTGPDQRGNYTLVGFIDASQASGDEPDIVESPVSYKVIPIGERKFPFDWVSVQRRKNEPIVDVRAVVTPEAGQSPHEPVLLDSLNIPDYRSFEFEGGQSMWFLTGVREDQIDEIRDEARRAGQNFRRPTF